MQAFPECGSSESGSIMSAERDAIVDVMRRWREATSRGDLAAIMRLMTPDAVFLTPGNAPMTREGFAQGFRAMGDGVKIEVQQEVHDVVVSGDLAYAWTHIGVAITPADGSRKQRAGHVLTLFRRTEHGWQLARDANLLIDHAAASPDASR